MSSTSTNKKSFLLWALIPVTALLTIIGTRHVSSGYIKNLRSDYEKKIAEKESKAEKDTENFKRQWVGLLGKYKSELSRAEAALQENKVLQQQLDRLKELQQSSK